MTHPDHPYAPPHTSETGSGTPNGRTSELRHQGHEVKDEATRQARELTEAVSEEAAKVVQTTADHARDLVDDAKQQLTVQARTQTEHLGGALEQLGRRTHALAEGRTDEAGPVGDYVERIASQVDQLAGKVNQLGFDGLVDEVQRFARRRPGAFLAGAAAAGLVASRLGRGVQAAEDEHGSNGSATASIPARASGAIATSPAPAGSPTSTVGGSSPTPPPVPPTPTHGTDPDATASFPRAGAETDAVTGEQVRR